ncbi:hypothetical protein RMR21_016105 [Agrobacterium sp. rho-8.1]
MTSPDRRQLVVVIPLDQAYVTSSAFSPHVGSIGLAIFKRGSERPCEKVVIRRGIRNEFTLGCLCNPVFVYPANEQFHV